MMGPMKNIKTTGYWTRVNGMWDVDCRTLGGAKRSAAATRRALGPKILVEVLANRQGVDDEGRLVFWCDVVA